MNRRSGRGEIRGFSLVEVMVAIVVICTGLLGIAKLQALSLSNTSTARLRSLAALEAASLASAMHSNRQYWSSTPPTSIQVTPNSPAAPTIVSSDAAMAAIATADLGAFPVLPQTCVGNAGSGSVCPAPNLAAFDLAWWLTSLSSLLPNPGATITCSNAAPAACTILITWTEKAMAMNSSETNVPGAQFQTPTYTLYVEP